MNRASYGTPAAPTRTVRQISRSDGVHDASGQAVEACEAMRRVPGGRGGFRDGGDRGEGNARRLRCAHSSNQQKNSHTDRANHL